ncbi:PrpR N-terminal domain-containing protein [Peptococcaceae bacterium 1198_IL3148]
MSKIKILAIAPYTGLRDIIVDVARERDDIIVHTYVADMLEAVKLVKSMPDKSYDAIISRAGTAELLRDVSELPVIDIKLSIIDMVRAINLAKNYSGKFAIAGYKVITDAANIICQLNKYDTEIETIYDISQIDSCLVKLKQQGISLIVGDVITISHAKRLGFNTILVTSGKESVTNSFEEAVNLIKLLAIKERKNLLIKSTLDNAHLGVMCFNQQKKIVYSNISADSEEYKLVIKEANCLIDLLMAEDTLKVMKKLSSGIVVIRGIVQQLNNEVYPTFYINNRKAPLKPLENAITYKNITDMPKINFETFSSQCALSKALIDSAKAYATTPNPIILFGDQGVGKDTLAHAIYYHSNYYKNPLVIIDTKYMHEKSWSSLFEAKNSIFSHSDITIYIKNLQFMDDASQKTFVAYFINTYVHKRNRFIFSCVSGYSQAFDQSLLLDFIRNEVKAIPLVIPNLNQRKEDIPSLASLFLGDLFIKYGKEVIGLDSEALQLLQDFSWTDNIDQLKRVMEQLVILTDTFYINADTVRKVLANEKPPQSQSYKHFLDLNKSLDDINKDIINLVLAEENFNQSKAAERLGISRSTLWRKIKDFN